MTACAPVPLTQQAAESDAQSVQVPVLDEQQLASLKEFPPILFIHGNGDSAAQWQTTLWRFESNGWPRERLFALRQPYPWALKNDSVPVRGYSSTADHMAFLKAEVERIRRLTGAPKVVLVANSRGGYAVRNYLLNGGGEPYVSKAILAGTPNHGVWNIPGFLDGSEFAGNGTFLKQLNRPKNAAGDEVVGPVEWMTLRSDRNDRYAQPDGYLIGKAGQSTHISYDGPELKGAKNVVLPGVDHRETAYSAPAFSQMFEFITGRKPANSEAVPEDHVQLGGVVTGMGANSNDESSGNFANGLPVPSARVEVFQVDPATGARVGAALLQKTVAKDGRWGPVEVQTNVPVELQVSASGYATTHYYRSGFPRSSSIVDLRAVRLSPTDYSSSASVVVLWRPRGYLDPSRSMSLDGAAPPQVPSGFSVAWSKITPKEVMRTVTADYEGEHLVGQTWPARRGHFVYLEVSR